LMQLLLVGFFLACVALTNGQVNPCVNFPNTNSTCPPNSNSDPTCANIDPYSTTKTCYCCCLPGYVLSSTAGAGCVAVDNCQNVDPLYGSCMADSHCTPTFPGIKCTCNSGYQPAPGNTMTGSGLACVDIDECAIGTDDCSKYATCTNTPGSFSCACNQYYSGDGVTCTPIDYCLPANYVMSIGKCDTNARCVSSLGAISCTCKSGWMGTGFICTDIDECMLGPPTNKCVQYSTCTNTPGSYTCTCNPHYSPSPDAKVLCSPVDDCKDSTYGYGSCDKHATCTLFTQEFLVPVILRDGNQHQEI